MSLARIDLNLLVALDALMSERSVTRAGQKIGLSQPAMSGVLARLRQHLGDELFIRCGDRMRPTPRAIEIAEPIRAALGQINSTLTEGTTLPALARRTFRLACNDLATALFLPRLIEELAIVSPGVNVTVNHADGERAIELLERGEADFAAGQYLEQSHQVASATLFDIPYACAVRIDHPLAGETMGLPELAKQSHIVVNQPGDPTRRLDQIFRRHKLSKRVVLQIPHYLVVPHLLQQTDFVAFLPRNMIRMSKTLGELTISDAEVSGLQAHAGLFWNSVGPDDDGKACFRSAIASSAKNMRLEDWLSP
jgi:DNA-binding transcriptional LysR family regulator